MMIRWAVALGLPLLAVMLSGCGGSDYELAPAQGKVTCNGQAIGGGRVVFSPIAEEGELEPGKPAVGLVQEDGTFILTTYDAEDGAIVGKHRVDYFSPEADVIEPDEGQQLSAEAQAALAKARSTPRCKLPGETILEVKSGETNEFNLELVPDDD